MDRRTHKLLNRHFINTLRNSNVFQPLEGYFQGVQLVQFSSVGQ